MTDDETAARERLRGRACRHCGVRVPGGEIAADGWAECNACAAGSEQHGTRWPAAAALQQLGVRPSDPLHRAVLDRRDRQSEDTTPWRHVLHVEVPAFSALPDASPKDPASRPWEHLRRHEVLSAAVDPDQPTRQNAGATMRPDGTHSRWSVTEPNRLRAVVLDALQAEIDAVQAVRRAVARVAPPDGGGCWTCGVARAPRARWRTTTAGLVWCGSPACVEPNRPGDAAFASASLRALMLAWKVDGARAALPSLIAADLARTTPWLYGAMRPARAPAAQPWRHLTHAEVAALVQRLDDEIERRSDPTAWENRHRREAAERAETERIEQAVARALAATTGGAK